MDFMQSITLIGVTTLVFLAKLCVGFTVSTFLPEKSQNLENSLVVGWAFVTLILYLVYRHSLPIILTQVLTSVIILSCFYSCTKYLKTNTPVLKNLSPIVLVGGCVFFIFDVAPSILVKNLFFQNWGPDLDGNLIVSSYVLNGNGFADLASRYQQLIGSEWWNSERIAPWKLADTTEGIASEFFLRANRYGQAVEAAYISQTLQVPVWLSLKSQMLSSGIIFIVFLYNYCRRLELNSLLAFIITLTFCVSQTNLFHYYEGINVQFIYLPICLYAMVHFQDITDPKKPEFILSLLCIVVLAITFGDAVQLLMIWMLLVLAINYRVVLDKKWLVQMFTICLIFIGIFFTAISDFIFWSILRFQDDFSGGALHYNFSVLNLLIPAPYFIVSDQSGREAIELFFNSRIRYNLISEVLLIVAVIFLRIDKSVKLFLLPILATLLIVTLTGHLYALWKAAVLFSPLVFPVLVSKICKKSSMLALVFCIVLVSSNLIASLQGVQAYASITKPFVQSQFQVTNYPSDECFGFITPSNSYEYIRLSNLGQFHWLNQAHRQYDLEINVNSMLRLGQCRIYSYYDCSIEGADECTRLENLGVPANTFEEIDVQLQQISVPEGKLIKQDVEQLIRSSFGLP